MSDSGSSGSPQPVSEEDKRRAESFYDWLVEECRDHISSYYSKHMGPIAAEVLAKMFFVWEVCGDWRCEKLRERFGSNWYEELLENLRQFKKSLGPAWNIPSLSKFFMPKLEELTDAYWEKIELVVKSAWNRAIDEWISPSAREYVRDLWLSEPIDDTVKLLQSLFITVDDPTSKAAGLTVQKVIAYLDPRDLGAFFRAVRFRMNKKREKEKQHQRGMKA